MMISVVAGITGVIAVVAPQHHAFGLHLQVLAGAVSKPRWVQSVGSCGWLLRFAMNM